MGRLVLILAVEVVLGIAVGGAVLAVLVPVLSHFGLVDSGGVWAAVVITGVLIVAVGFMVLRPGSALNRRFQR